MSGVRNVGEYAVVDGSTNNNGVKQSKKRKKRVSPTEVLSNEGWRRLNMEDVQVEGFEDGSVFELEELTDYTLQTSESGAKVLVMGGQKVEDDAPADDGSKKKRKRKKTTKQSKETTEDKVQVKAEEEEDVKFKVEDAEESKVKVEEDAVEEQEETPLKEETTAVEETEEKEETKPKQKKEKKEKKEKKTKAKAAPAKKAVAKAAPVPAVSLPKWDKYKLHPLLRHSLHACGFLSPTPIQEQTIYPALVDNRDIVGAAPTGSGKTLAFGLPILSQLLFEKDRPGYVKNCKALILTPTRELALQIHQHLEKMVPNREIGVMTLVGGMAVQKQMRMMSYKPEIVIGTPGRLWDLIDSNHAHLKDLDETLRFLVIDEADRMLQKGSYAEVEKIFEVVKYNSNKHATPVLRDLSDTESDNEDEEMNDPLLAGESKVMMLDDVMRAHEKQKLKEANGEKDSDDEEEEEEEEEPQQQAVAVTETTRHIPRQTFLFSATLTIPDGGRFQTGKKKHRHALTVLESVMKRVGLRGKPAVVDLSIDETLPKGTIMSDEEKMKLRAKQQENVSLSLPAGLELCQHEVTDDTRDSYLYYFLTQYPGKTIVFLNAIHQVRKLANLLLLLKMPVFALHAEMQQRQRLKKLDGFRANPKGILIATDVAARGLDIPSVDYVVHYHIARSTEVYLHRSGRTARAQKEGLSISLVAPADAKYHSQICKMLKRPTGLAEFPFDHRFLPVIDERLRLAKAINDHENVAGKVKSEETWFSQMAKEADLDLDDNLMQELKSKKDNSDSTKKKNGESVESMRHELARVLAEPLRPIGSIRKFRQLYQEIGTQVTSDGEYKKRHASEDLESKSKKSYKRFRRR